MFTKDYNPNEFKRLVIFGESTVEGGGWLENKHQRFADIVADLINTCQSSPVEYFNEGIGASVISPRSPGYQKSRKPSALERYRERVIDRNPDLFVFCYGLNDMRCANPVEPFIEDMETILADVESACNPITVLASVYYSNGFDRYAPFNQGSVETTLEYNRAIRALAEKYDCVYADVWDAEGMADHVIHQDGVHANRVGNLLIAHKIFEAIAQNCSGLSVHTRALDASTEWTKKCREMAYRK